MLFAILNPLSQGPINERQYPKQTWIFRFNTHIKAEFRF